MIYIQLFLSFLQIGLFSVGGGYAAISTGTEPDCGTTGMDHDDWSLRILSRSPK